MYNLKPISRASWEVCKIDRTGRLVVNLKGEEDELVLLADLWRWMDLRVLAEMSR